MKLKPSPQNPIYYRHQRNDLRGIDLSRQIPRTAWLLWVLLTLTTFAAFMLLDPYPDLLLSTCVAVNVAICIWTMYRLYQWNILFSPVSTVFLGPSMLLYYSWGNLGARITGEGRLVSHFGSLNYYPLVSLLSAIALLVFCIVVFGIFPSQTRFNRIRFQDLDWEPRQAGFVTIFTIAMLSYLSYKYPFTGGYFRGVDNAFDKWLASSAAFFVMLAALIGISVAVKATNHNARIIGTIALFATFTLTLGLRSRTFMILVATVVTLGWITLQPKKVASVLLQVSSVIVVLFVLGTAIKVANVSGETASILDNLSAVITADAPDLLSDTQRGLDYDYQYRTAGFEFTAAILQCLDLGVSPMYGDGIIEGFVQGLPGFIRPSGSFSERGAVGKHFLGRCLKYDDSIGIPLAGGIADWGLFGGIFLYAVAGLLCIGLWGLVQRSPYLFVAYLMIPALPDSFLWDKVFIYIKSMGFALLVLFIFKNWLMPQWQPQTSSDIAQIKNARIALYKGIE